MSFLKNIKNSLNLKVISKHEIDEISQNLSMIKADQMFTENYKNMALGDDGRPSLGMPYLDTATGAKYPLWRIPPARLFWLAEEVSDFRVVLETIQWEMFKNGIKIEPKFKYKCEECLKTFKEIPAEQYIPFSNLGQSMDKIQLKCDECGNDDESKFSQPESVQRRILQEFFDSYVNDNEQTLLKVARQVEYDLDTVDSSYTLISKEYKTRKLASPDPATGATAEVVSSTLKEMLRINPSTVSIIADDDGKLGYTKDRKPAWICPNYAHRYDLLPEPFCEKCGLKAFTALIETSIVPFGPPVSNVKRTYYTRKEVIWIPAKYRIDLLYGVAPAVAIWKKILSLYNQDEYLWKYFDKNRPPKSLLAMGSRNQESIKAFWKRNTTGASVDPYMPRPILLNTENVKGAIEFIDLTPNFKELELSSVRNEMRRAIAALFGVQPLFLGESGGGSSGSKGSGAGALQFTATNRRIKAYQTFLNDNFFTEVVKLLDVTDYTFRMVESEEVDIMRDHQTKGIEIGNAVQMYNMGFDIRTNGNGDLEFSQYPNPERQMMMMMGSGSGTDNSKSSKATTGKKTSPDKEQSTNFGGEPLPTRQSDDGGIAGGDPASGSSFGNKMIKMIERGLANDWTINNMSKKLASETDNDAEYCKVMIKQKMSEGL